MKRLAVLALIVGVMPALAGCYMSSGVDLRKVAMETGMSNITTGDGDYGNYTAVGHYKATEIGFGLGVPLLVKLMELPPILSDEGLVKQIAEEARDDGAKAMINVAPPKSLFTGIPFFFLGFYVDKTDGTGIQ